MGSLGHQISDTRMGERRLEDGVFVSLAAFPFKWEEMAISFGL